MRIHRSAWRGDVETVKAELDAGVSPDCLDEQGSSVLVTAAYSPVGLAVMQLLLDRGADPNLTCAFNRRPLDGTFNHWDKFQLLLRYGAVLPDASDGLPARCSREVAEYFLEHGYDPGAGDGKALVASAHGCDWPMFRFLASRTNNLSSLLWTPLMRAIILGNSEDVVNELEQAPDLVSKDANERTAFMLSVCSGDVAKMKLVYAAGGALSDRGHCEESVLDCAIISRSPEMLRGLLDLGVDPNLAGVLSQPALMSAVENSNLEAIRILLDYGADLTCIDDCGQKLVNFATDVGCMKLLVELGADPDYIDGTGMFPLKAAVEDGNVELVRCLIGFGANVNNQRFGLTALQQATNYDHLEIMKILLEAGANPNAAENDVGEWMPLWWAKSREAAQILIDGGASLVLCDAFGKNAYLHHSTAEFRDILKPN